MAKAVRQLEKGINERFFTPTLILPALEEEYWCFLFLDFFSDLF